MEDYTLNQPDLSTIKPARKASLKDGKVKVFEDCIKAKVFNELIVDVGQNGVFCVDNVLSTIECEHLCVAISNSEDLSFWSKGDDAKPQFRMFRNAHTIEAESKQFSNAIWSRVESILHILKLNIGDDDNDANHERELVGEWIPSGLNHHVLFAKYPSMGAFAPHTDGRTIDNFNTRSFYSVIIFLNDIPLNEGGGTRFYDNIAVKSLRKKTVNGVPFWTADPSLVQCEIESKRGRMLIFHQSLVHEGVPPVPPHEKFIIRSDVMMRRSVPLCDSESDIEAYAMFRMAEDLSESGDVDGAVVLFKKAFKISPAMAAIMGQC